jgi:hypothetical protein
VLRDGECGGGRWGTRAVAAWSCLLLGYGDALNKWGMCKFEYCGDLWDR